MTEGFLPPVHIRRRPVAMVTVDGGNALVVLCDDGSVWTGAVYYGQGTIVGDWRNGEPVPGTPADDELEAARQKKAGGA